MTVSKQSITMRYISGVIRSLVLGGEIPEKPADIPWNAVYSLANAHTVAGTLWYALEDKLRVECDPELVKRWDRQRSIEFAKNVVQTAEFKHLTELFTEHKYSFLPMKGFLYKELWGRPEYRSMADMDIYVGEDQLAGVSELLLAEGYVREAEDYAVHSFSKPPYLNVELHRSFFRGSHESFDSWIPKEDNPYWYVLPPVEFMVFSVEHIKKHFSSGGCGARSIFDVYLFLEKRGDTLDRTALEERLREIGLYDFYYELLHLVYFWCGNGSYPFEVSKKYIRNGVPTEALLEMEYFISTGGAYGSEANKVKYGVEHKGRFRFALKVLFPGWVTMRSFFPWLRKCPILLPIAYPLRWFKHLFSGKFFRYAGHLFRNKKRGD